MSEEEQVAQKLTEQAAHTVADTTALHTDAQGRLLMSVKVYAPFEVFYEGDAYSVSAVNALGPFDVLPHHHKFLCMVVPCNVVVDTPEGKKSIRVSRALMHIKADHVAVFVDV